MANCNHRYAPLDSQNVQCAECEFVRHRIASDDLRTLSQRLSQGKGTMGKLLSEDETLYNDLVASVSSLKAVSERLEKGEG